MGYVTKASKGRFRLDYVAARKLIEKRLTGKCQAVAFNSVDKRYQADRGLVEFYHTIRRAGFVVNLYQMEGESQKQVDVAIASHGVWRASRGDDIVLSSGDIDFLPAVRVITEMAQRKLYLLSYDFGVQPDLAAAATEHWFFEDYQRELEIA